MDDPNDLTLDPNAIADPLLPDPSGDPVGAAAKPTFLLEIDAGTRFDDAAKAKEAFANLRNEGGRHRTEAETLRAQVKQLQTALGAPDHIPEAELTAAEIATQREWLRRSNPHLKLAQLGSPEFKAAIAEAFAEQRVDSLLDQGEMQITRVLAKHKIELDEAARFALGTYVGNYMRHPSSEILNQRFMAGDMSVLDELVEKLYAADIRDNAAAAAAAAAAKQDTRDARGRFAEVQRAKDRMKGLPAAPPAGSGASIASGQPLAYATPEERKKQVEEMLGRAS
jgi:hypothetical protein